MGSVSNQIKIARRGSASTKRLKNTVLRQFLALSLSCDPLVSGADPAKLIERGSYRVKGASGVFRMRERGARRSGGRKSPSGVQGQSPGRGRSPPEAEAFLLMNAKILTFWSNKISKKVILSHCMEYSLYLIWGRLQILGGSGLHVTPLDPPVPRDRGTPKRPKFEGEG